MSIIQISKIQQRSGELVDLPQLDQAEFGFAADVNRLFIGKTTGNTENVEVLTAYSDIAFSQLDGAGNTNLNINDLTLANGQMLIYDGNNWVNGGAGAGGYINLGSVSNIAIEGGGINYVLTTDGTGNLSWTPKSFVTANIADISQANPGVVTTVEQIFLTKGSEVTITRVNGMSNVNGQSYFIGNLTANSFALYSDITLNNPVDTTSFDAYVSGGIITCAVGGSEGSANAAGSLYEIQFNYNNLLYADSDFKYDFINSLFVLNGTANISTDVNVEGNIVVNYITANGNISGNNLSLTGTSNLNSISNVTITGGINGQVLATYGNGSLYWRNITDPETGYYVHSQSSANAIWTVEHNLNTQFVDVTPITAAGYSFIGRYDFPAVNYINANALTLTFNSAVDGYVVVVGDSSSPTSYYTETQASAITTWTINHNLDTQFVAVTPIFANGRSIIGRYDYPTVFYNNANTCTITFDSATAGNVAVVGSANSDGYYLHDQSVASTSWTVNHNLNTQYLSVTPVAANGYSYVGRYDYPNVYYNNANSLTLTFSSAVAGNVAVIGSGGLDLPAAGLDTYVQYNDGGSLNGSPGFTFDKTSNSITLSGNVVATEFRGTSLTTGANSTAGTLTGNWTLTSGSRLTATYADLAEYYCADRNYEPGTVLEFGGDQEVTVAKEESNRIAGVVSTNPAYVMNATLECEENSLMIALIGRVPVKVKGAVSKGDMLVSAGQGFAKASIVTPKIGTVIGKAISNKNDDGEGVVEVLVGRL